jgi:hypothetical protein
MADIDPFAGKYYRYLTVVRSNLTRYLIFFLPACMQVSLYKKLLTIPDFKISGAGLAAAQVRPLLVSAHDSWITYLTILY